VVHEYAAVVDLDVDVDIARFSDSDSDVDVDSLLLSCLPMILSTVYCLLSTVCMSRSRSTSRSMQAHR
jgi:hypothetical protein